ncbi:hypothetical protein NKI88_07920 [Mesorhizobium sp. M0317]|uniref:hypothetical protein n=1 Tax=Mesorhizobium sp. M0317 TaxID=2956935 RepID=UPI00333D3D0A
MANTEIENRRSFAGHQAVFEAIERRASGKRPEQVQFRFGQIGLAGRRGSALAQSKSPPFKAGGLPSIIQRDPVADNQDDRISAFSGWLRSGGGLRRV